MSMQTLFYALFGWLVGVLVNHAADITAGRAPLGSEPVCPYCNTPRAPAAWSAVVGYLSGRRLCLGCGAPLPMRAVIVELATPVIFVGLLWRYGLCIQLGLLCLYSAVLILVSVTDLEHRMIPHAVMAPALLLAIAGAFFSQEMSARRAMLGGVVGLAVLYGMYLLARPVSRWLGRLAHRSVDDVPFGFGDVTLGAFVGLITGLPGVFLALIITLLSAGLVAAIVLVARSAVRRHYTPFATIPYGPFLALGGFVMMVYGAEIITWYVSR
jgi:leader peptidase (prepilin peptidase) / N-methyltransferase